MELKITNKRISMI